MLISQLEDYLCCLSLELNSELFEIVPVEFYTDQNEIRSISALNAKSNSCKRKRSEETETQRQKRLKKARDYKKRKISEETENDALLLINSRDS